MERLYETYTARFELIECRLFEKHVCAHVSRTKRGGGVPARVLWGGGVPARESRGGHESRT
eukprot:7754046-Pyramimonas_sp.AAC.1